MVLGNSVKNDAVFKNVGEVDTINLQINRYWKRKIIKKISVICDNYFLLCFGQQCSWNNIVAGQTITA